MLLFYFFPCTISILTRKFDGRDIFEEIYHTVLSGKICKMKKHSQDIKTWVYIALATLTLSYGSEAE